MLLRELISSKSGDLAGPTDSFISGRTTGKILCKLSFSKQCLPVSLFELNYDWEINPITLWLEKCGFVKMSQADKATGHVITT